MISIHGVSYCGDHAENEDSLLIAPHPLQADLQLAAIADGQGGRAGGATASHQAVDFCLQAAMRLATTQLARPSVWRRLLRSADAYVASDPAAGLTTLIGLCAGPEGIVGASSGDSAAALFQHGRPPLILTERQHKNPPVGSGGAIFETFLATPAWPWKLLLMTDGVWKYAGWEAIMNLADPARTAEELAADLAARARLPGSGEFPDDFSLAVFACD